MNKPFLYFFRLTGLGILIGLLIPSFGYAKAKKSIDFTEFTPGFISLRDKTVRVKVGDKIQEAIDRSGPHTTVLVSPGIYHENLVLKPGITLKSQAGPAETTIDGQGKDKPLVVMADDSVLEGFTVTGRGDGGRKDKKGIHAVECIDVSALVKNNIIKGNQSTGIVSKGKKAHPLIVGNTVRENEGSGIGNTLGSSATIANNEITENYYSGIGNQKGSKAWIVNNHSYHNLWVGVSASGEGTSPLIEDNRIYSNVFSGIGVEKGAGPTIKNNKIRNNNRAGIGVAKGARPVILKNHITENVLSGIGIIDASTVFIKGNLLAENGIAGVTVMDGSKATIIKNRVVRNITQGIICTASYVTIRNNRIVNNQHHGVGIYRGAQVFAYKNYISGNGGDSHRGNGIMVISSGEGVLIEKNVLKNNYGPGVYCRRSSPVIKGNKFSNDSIDARDYSAPRIDSNYFDSFGKVGRVNKGGVNCRNQGHPVIVNNIFCGNFGIAVRRTSNALIVGNIFSGLKRSSIASARSGIMVSNTSAPVIKRNLFYNGNGILTDRGFYKKNLNEWEMNKGLWKRVSKKTQILPVTITDNLFLEK